MKRTYLGEFEEVVLLTVAVLHEGAYGVAITDELDRQTGRSVSISAVHAALHRLEEKGMLKSQQRPNGAVGGSVCLRSQRWAAARCTTFGPRVISCGIRSRRMLYPLSVYEPQPPYITWQ